MTSFLSAQTRLSYRCLSACPRVPFNRGASHLRAVKYVSSFVLKTRTRIGRTGIQDYATTQRKPVD